VEIDNVQVFTATMRQVIDEMIDCVSVNRPIQTVKIDKVVPLRSNRGEVIESETRNNCQ